MVNEGKISIEVSIPRDDEKRFCDLLHLNGFPTEVFQSVGGPVVIRIFIKDEQFIGVPVAYPVGTASKEVC